MEEEEGDIEKKNLPISSALLMNTCEMSGSVIVMERRITTRVRESGVSEDLLMECGRDD